MYGSTDKEGPAVVDSCKHFLSYLVGRSFTIVTDHRALKFLSGKDPTSGRLARWFDALRDLNFEIKYRPGKQNENADALSRQAWDDDFNLDKGGRCQDHPDTIQNVCTLLRFIHHLSFIHARSFRLTN